MTFHWLLVSILLVVETIIVYLLILPVSFINNLVQKLVRPVLRNKNVRLGLKITAGLLLYLTVASGYEMNRLASRIQTETLVGNDRLQLYTRKFRNERNFYLAMSTLTILGILIFVERIIFNRRQAAKEQ
mmetsp:Transcript_13608/g.15021  ORF Transcript_13608/g.15021 Transcript_13608/m.15021 type:complete len:130 (+) Transcript_13608:38-427(+)